MPRVKDQKEPWERIKRTVGQIGDQRLEVGIFDPNDHELAQRLFWNEFGVPEGKGSRIHERPAMQTALDRNSKAYGNIMEQGVSLMYQGKISAGRILDTLGKRAEADIKASIDAWSDPPNAPSTVRQKGRNDPLVDSGDMRDAVGYQVVGI